MAEGSHTAGTARLSRDLVEGGPTPLRSRRAARTRAAHHLPYYDTQPPGQSGVGEPVVACAASRRLLGEDTQRDPGGFDAGPTRFFVSFPGLGLMRFPKETSHVRPERR